MIGKDTLRRRENNDIKSNTRLMDIFIQEDYALNKDGKKL
jgi:hypothetical protein